MTIFTHWKPAKSLIKFCLISYFVFPFTRNDTISANEILKQKTKQKVPLERKKIFGCLDCQNQALDHFHISL